MFSRTVSALCCWAGILSSGFFQAIFLVENNAYCITPSPPFLFWFHFLLYFSSINPLHPSPVLFSPLLPSHPLFSSCNLLDSPVPPLHCPLLYLPSSCLLILCSNTLHKTIILYLYVTETLLILLTDGSIWSSKPADTKRSLFFTSGSLTADGWQNVS